MSLSHEELKTSNPKHQQKSKSIFSPEQNYFALFALRYPVVESFWQFSSDRRFFCVKNKIYVINLLSIHCGVDRLC